MCSIVLFLSLSFLLQSAVGTRPIPLSLSFCAFLSFPVCERLIMYACVCRLCLYSLSVCLSVCLSAPASLFQGRDDCRRPKRLQQQATSTLAFAHQLPVETGCRGKVGSSQ